MGVPPLAEHSSQYPVSDNRRGAWYGWQLITANFTGASMAT